MAPAPRVMYEGVVAGQGAQDVQWLAGGAVLLDVRQGDFLRRRVVDFPPRIPTVQDIGPRVFPRHGERLDRLGVDNEQRY